MRHHVALSFATLATIAANIPDSKGDISTSTCEDSKTIISDLVSREAAHAATKTLLLVTTAQVENAENNSVESLPLAMQLFPKTTANFRNRSGAQMVKSIRTELADYVGYNVEEFLNSKNKELFRLPLTAPIGWKEASGGRDWEKFQESTPAATDFDNQLDDLFSDPSKLTSIPGYRLQECMEPQSDGAAEASCALGLAMAAMRSGPACDT